MNRENADNSNNQIFQGEIVAAFDFDKTLTYRDTLLPFLIFSFGFVRVVLGFSKHIFYFMAYALSLVTRQQVKEKILTEFFGGMSLDLVNSLGRRFAEKKLDSLLRSEALKRLRWHQLLGHRCIIVSAAIEPYLLFLAKRHQISDIIASKLEVDSQKKITGKLLGLNCWGPEKVERLKQVFGQEKKYFLYAYGDSRGDKELLSYADKGFFKTFSEE